MLVAESLGYLLHALDIYILTWPSMCRQVSGMTCSACSSAVEAALDSLPGVDNAVVSLIQQQARVEYDTAAATPVRPDICKQITEL